MLGRARKPIASEKRLELIKLLFGDVSGKAKVNLGEGVSISLENEGNISDIHLSEGIAEGEYSDLLINVDNILLTSIEKLATKLGNWRSETFTTVMN